MQCGYAGVCTQRDSRTIISPAAIAAGFVFSAAAGILFGAILLAKSPHSILSRPFATNDRFLLYLGLSMRSARTDRHDTCEKGCIAETQDQIRTSHNVRGNSPGLCLL